MTSSSLAPTVSSPSCSAWKLKRVRTTISSTSAMPLFIELESSNRSGERWRGAAADAAAVFSLRAILAVAALSVARRADGRLRMPPPPALIDASSSSGGATG